MYNNFFQLFISALYFHNLHLWDSFCCPEFLFQRKKKEKHKKKLRKDSRKKRKRQKSEGGKDSGIKKKEEGREGGTNGDGREEERNEGEKKKSKNRRKGGRTGILGQFICILGLIENAVTMFYSDPIQNKSPVTP